MAEVRREAAETVFPVSDTVPAGDVSSIFVRRSSRLKKTSVSLNVEDMFRSIGDLDVSQSTLGSIDKIIAPVNAKLQKKGSSLARKRKATLTNSETATKRPRVPSNNEDTAPDTVGSDMRTQLDHTVVLSSVDSPKNPRQLKQELVSEEVTEETSLRTTTPLKIATRKATDRRLAGRKSTGKTAPVTTLARERVPRKKAVKRANSNARSTLDTATLGSDVTVNSDLPGTDDNSHGHNLSSKDGLNHDVSRSESLQERSANAMSNRNVPAPSIVSKPIPTVIGGPGAKKTVEVSNASKRSKVSVADRPEAHGAPLVWAEGRQALCETLPYYRAYQSGAYTSNGIAYGFLLNYDPTGRSFMDEEVVIARAGGHCGLNQNGDMVQISDHSFHEAAVISFLRNMTFSVPLVLIVGKKNRACPVEVPHEYNVMDWFQVTDIWAENNNDKVCIKFRFEKLYRETRSWWAMKDSIRPCDQAGFSANATKHTCIDCHTEHKQVFQQGWMCLNENCAKFWVLNGDVPPPDLIYNTEFLRERTQWPKEIMPPFNLRPELPQADGGQDVGYAYSRRAWKGIVCPLCGRCNSRRRWDAWYCETEGCDFVHQLSQPVLSPRAVLHGHEVEYRGHAMPLDSFSAPVTLRKPEFNGEWRIHTYELCPGNTITHFHANESVNATPGGAHDMFMALQMDGGFGLQRFPMTVKTGQGEVLAQHFALNFGLPYKYVVAVESKGFMEAPTSILKAREQLDWARRSTVNNENSNSFNELLAVGYFEESKMGFHDDGERELGPTIATLSLGGSAVMSLRMKARYYCGMTKSGNFKDTEPVLPGSLLEAERKALYARRSQISAAEYEFTRDQLFRRIKKTRSPPVFLNMSLSHGDIVVMHGAEMQKYYEHTIVPSGKMRFGLTCRYIKPELVDERQHWKAVLPTDVPDDGTATNSTEVGSGVVISTPETTHATLNNGDTTNAEAEVLVESAL